MKDQINLFNSLYDYFYETESNGYDCPLENCLNNLFDYLLKNNQEFKDEINAFNKARQDIIISDREAQAYMCMYLIIQELKRIEREGK